MACFGIFGEKTLNFQYVFGLAFEMFNGVDFGQVNYSKKENTIWFAVILVVLLLLKLKFGRNKFSQKYSGYFIDSFYHQGFLNRFCSFVARTIFVFGVLLLLIALSDPFISVVKTITIARESRERIDLIDVSTSKGWLFEKTDKPAGQLGREAHLNFLKMRQGKNDRVSLWLFTASAFRVENFIVDDNLYHMQVEDAPYVILDSGNPFLGVNYSVDNNCDVTVPDDKIQFVLGEGNTRLDVGLKAVIKHFDNEGSKKIKRKALLIETDAAIEVPVDNELQELQKRNIILYVIHIKPNIECEKRGSAFNVPAVVEKLKDGVEKSGGKFYNVMDKRSIEQAYRDIDKTEADIFKEIKTTNKIPLFQLFIFWGVLTLATAALLSLVVEVSGVYS